MHEISAIDELPPLPKRAVIVLRRHGLTLDAVFRRAPADTILLVDSDLEIRDGRVVAAMSTRWGRQRGLRQRFPSRSELAWRRTRPSGMCGVARRADVDTARLAAYSTRASRAGGRGQLRAAPQFRRISSASAAIPLAGLPLLVPGIRHLRFAPIAPEMLAAGSAERPANPAFANFDTGALLHDRLLAQGYRYRQLDTALWGDFTHYHGVTRAGLSARLRKAARASGLLGGSNETAQRLVLSEVTVAA